MAEEEVAGPQDQGEGSEVDAPVTQEAAPDDEFAAIRQRYEADEDLTDDDLDLIADTAIAYIRDILGYFGENAVSVDEYDGDDGELILDVSGGDLAVLIGRHGRTLEALQMVVSSYMSNKLKFHFPIVVDIEGYKGRRREKLQSLARSSAARAKKQKGSVSMAPMNAYERRIVHMTLADDEEVTTHSVGEDPDRRVVVTYVRS